MPIRYKQSVSVLSSGGTVEHMVRLKRLSASTAMLMDIFSLKNHHSCHKNVMQEYFRLVVISRKF